MPEPLTPDSRGTLFPDRLPVSFRRLPASVTVSDVVAWWWISEWDLAPGEQSIQHLLAFPATNLVVEDTMVGLSGPATRASTRTLQGRGWAVAALLRPAAVPAFTEHPGSLRDCYQPIDLPDLHALVAASEGHLDDAVEPFARWLLDRATPLAPDALLANRMVSLASDDSSIATLGDLASRLNVSERTLHRLALRYVGLTPYAIIRRRRLQEAAASLREQPGVPIAEVAARFGFSDHAHFAREFSTLVGRTPAGYRAAVTSE